ncbi:hypothetical protein [Candidatus Cyanaurora vandensis]|uniref:hypothetical protein n=2 Tax=Candidatus Cyanaurora vandensis TaxID=2714958 RepID=UPI00257FD7F6|nr:hypothetical protein [Candidatus Cyanaurora vandensis]
MARGNDEPLAVRRRSCLGLLVAAPVLAQPRPLTDFLPLLRNQLLPTVNRAYRRTRLASRVVFLGQPKLQSEKTLQVRMIERWPLFKPPVLQMLLIERQVSFAQARGRWWLVESTFTVQALPPETPLGPTPRQYLDETAPLSNPTVGTFGLNFSDGAFAQALRELLDQWQDGYLR